LTWRCWLENPVLCYALSKINLLNSRGAAAAVVVFDVTNQASFERAKKWVKNHTLSWLISLIVRRHKHMLRRTVFSSWKLQRKPQLMSKRYSMRSQEGYREYSEQKTQQEWFYQTGPWIGQ
ncbi:hypothetical protein F2Q68_00006252, partial [Brassica cretica]